jgi:hypothetical protein
MADVCVVHKEIWIGVSDAAAVNILSNLRLESQERCFVDEHW